MHDISSNNNYLSPAIALGPNGLMCTYFSADLLGYIQGSAYKMFDDTNGRVIAVYTDKTDGYKAKSVVLNTDGTTARAVTAMASGAAYTRKFTAFPNLDLCVAACADTTNGVNVLWLDIFDPNP